MFAVCSFVVENQGKVTDFFSFYKLPCVILVHPEKDYRPLRIAYEHYTVPGTYSIVKLMRDCLVICENKGYDVLYALDIKNNKEWIKKYSFQKSQSFSNFHLYNYRIKSLYNHEVGVVPLQNNLNVARKLYETCIHEETIRKN